MEEVKAKASSSRSKKGEISDDLEFDEKEKRETTNSYQSILRTRSKY